MFNTEYNLTNNVGYKPYKAFDFSNINTQAQNAQTQNTQIQPQIQQQAQGGTKMDGSAWEP